MNTLQITKVVTSKISSKLIDLRVHGCARGISLMSVECRCLVCWCRDKSESRGNRPLFSFFDMYPCLHLLPKSRGCFIMRGCSENRCVSLLANLPSNPSYAALALTCHACGRIGCRQSILLSVSTWRAIARPLGRGHCRCKDVGNTCRTDKDRFLMFHLLLRLC